MRPGRRIRDPLACDDYKQNQCDADKRRFQHATRAQKSKIKSEEQSDWNGCRQRKRGPWRGLERVDDYQRDHAEKNDHDGQDRKLSNEAAALADFFAGYFAESPSVAPDGAEENDEVLYASGEDSSRDQPQRAGQVAELCGKRGADERARPSNGGEMMAKQNPFIGGHEVAAIVVTFGGSCAGVIQGQQACRDERGIKAISDQVRAARGDHKPGGI